MSLRVVFGPEASTEVEEAAVWYEAQRSGLGLAFLGAVDAVVEQIAGWPDAGSLVAGIDEQLAVRRAPVPRFPYYLAYVLAADDALPGTGSGPRPTTAGVLALTRRGRVVRAGQVATRAGHGHWKRAGRGSRRAVVINASPPSSDCRPLTGASSYSPSPLIWPAAQSRPASWHGSESARSPPEAGCQLSGSLQHRDAGRT